MGQAQFLSITTPKSAVGDRVPREHEKVLQLRRRLLGEGAPGLCFGEWGGQGVRENIPG